MKSLSDRTFYGLAPLCENDIDFFLTTPSKERGGAYIYEMYRQAFVRAIGGKFLGTLTGPPIMTVVREEDSEEGDSFNFGPPIDFAKLRESWEPELKTSWPEFPSLLPKFWASNFKSPWNTLAAEARNRWVKEWKKRDDTNHIRWTHTIAGALVEDPDRYMSGNLVVMKIDWDLSDTQIIKLFGRSLRNGRPKTSVLPTKNGFRLIDDTEPMRPRNPISERRESVDTCLRAIAMQRIFDLRGSDAPEEFAAAFTDGKLPKKDQVLITHRRIDDGKEFYKKLERATGIEDLGWSTFDDASLPHPHEREHQGFRLVHAALTR